jgi:hypothetical protein
MKTCIPCDCRFRTWAMFARHMSVEHAISLALLRRRHDQVGERPVAAVRSVGGRWALMVQEDLGL